MYSHSNPASIAFKTMARRCWKPITNMAPSQLLNVMSGVPNPIVDLLVEEGARHRGQKSRTI